MEPNHKIISEGEVADFVDKGKGALLILEVTTFDVTDGNKTKLFVNTFSLFLRGIGGFGGVGGVGGVVTE